MDLHDYYAPPIEGYYNNYSTHDYQVHNYKTTTGNYNGIAMLFYLACICMITHAVCMNLRCPNSRQPEPGSYQLEEGETDYESYESDNEDDLIPLTLEAIEVTQLVEPAEIVEVTVDAPPGYESLVRP